MKVLVTTIVALNPGDAAILLGTKRLLERAFGDEVEVVAVDKQARAAASLYPWIRFVPSLFARRRRSWLGRRIARLGYEHRLKRLDDQRFRLAARARQSGGRLLPALLTSAEELSTIDEYLSADLILASGGTYIVPAYDMASPLRDYEFTLALGKPLGVMPQSMGPFHGSRLAPRYRDVFNRCRLLLVRDPKSKQHLEAIGVPASRVDVVPDAAFMLVQEASVPNSGNTLRVAISVREWKHFAHDPVAAEERYLDGVAALAAWLVREHHAEVTFLSSCQGIPQYWTDDAVTADRVATRLPDDVRARVVIDRTFRDPEALQAVLATFDAVVATRMHVAILALCTGRPVLPIAYEFKTRELFAALGQGDRVVPIEEATETVLVDRMRRLLGDQAATPAVHAGVLAFRDRLDAAAITLRLGHDASAASRHAAGT